MVLDPLYPVKPNALGVKLRLEVGAQRTLEGVACTRWFGWGRSLSRDAPSHCAHSYLITSSARMRSVGGNVTPRAWAVLRLRTNSNFMACSTGSSAGLAPLRILFT